MEELRRHRIRQPGQVIDPCSEGEWVRFSDVAERDKEARELEAERDALLRDIGRLKERKRGDKARIETLEAEKLHLRVQFDERQARIEELEAEWEAAKPRFEGDAQAHQLIYEFIRDLRSLLDSGEEKKASEPAIYEGYGRKWEPVKGTSALREVGDTGPDWDQCVYHMIGGRVQRFLMAEREARPSPSPALEGREERINSEFVGIRDALGDDILDEQVCCDGNSGPPTYCGCRGETVRDVLAYAEQRLAGQPVSQGMVRDGEVVVARADLQVALDWRSDDPEDNYPDVNEAFDRLRSVLAREGGDE